MKRDELLRLYLKMGQLTDKCQCTISDECGLSDLTVKQIGYIKLIGRYEQLTFSKLAAITNHSKPTITQMINRFIKQGCVYKEKCHLDGRVAYIRLTTKGEKIARMDEHINRLLVAHMVEMLSEDEIDTLIKILAKL